MYKKILSFLLTILLLASSVPVVSAEENPASGTRRVTIANFKNLERLAENCRLDSYSVDLVVSLQGDLDLTGKSFAGIPIFCGRFEGNGHTIRGLNITEEGSAQGFFRYLTESAAVNDLHLEGCIQPSGTGSEVGGFAGENSGILQNCSFTGTVSGKEYIGGIAGVNTVTGMIDSCHVSGSVFGGHFIGGIAGKNEGTIRTCENDALINKTTWQNKVELSDITLDSVIHSEAANTVTDVGGIAGNNTGMIRDCINQESVGYPSIGYNIGGIAGTQSGSILNCENRGEIFGRKEVGGIVGQMEPSSVMKFQEDVLQILNRQLDGLGKAVGKATSNLEGAGETILNQMGGMYDYIWNTEAAIEALIPNADNPQLPDWDTIQAARNNIGSNLSGMTRLMEGVGASAYNALGKVSANLHAINDQMNLMRTTIGNISETTGGSILDRSDEDTEEDLSGKVAECRNFGNVQADLNCGGIAGAVSLENDMDMEEDWLIQGENSLNFESELRAVILNCENSGEIAAGKQNIGGIVGFQSLGLVKSSYNSGRLDAAKADYVGGISGRSMGYIRTCHANCQLFGKNFVGGIAGSAAVATDCCALVQIGSGLEKLGAILGSRESNRMELENPVSGNNYLAVQEDPGAIDGISYDGLAQPLREDAFFLQDHLPDMFRHVSVTFRYSNGTERIFTVDFGSTFPQEWIPPIPPKEDRQSYWKGLENAELSGICFDLVFEQAYTNQITVLESDVARNGIPLLLVQGVFSEDAVLCAENVQDPLSLKDGETLLEMWQFRNTEADAQTGIRIQLPDGTDTEKIRIFIRGGDGAWRTEAHHILGRYAIAPITPADDAIALVEIKRIPWMLIGIFFAGTAALTGVLVFRKRKMKQ